MNRNRKINLFVKTMVEKNITFALGERMTYGLAAHLLSTCKGISRMLKGSIVSLQDYHNGKFMEYL